MNDLLIGVGGSIIGAIIWALGSKVYSHIKYYTGSEYSGTWEDIIPARSDGTPEKHDEFIIKHNTYNGPHVKTTEEELIVNTF